MQKKISKLPFKGTAEQEKKLREIIDANKHDKSLLMAVMQQAQDVYGYLPMEVQEMIAEGMDVPLEKVYGVSTFYAQFSLSPKGEYNISVCLGTACYVKGSGRYFQQAERKTRNRCGRMYRGRQIFAYRLPLYRRLRLGAGAYC